MSVQPPSEEPEMTQQRDVPYKDIHEASRIYFLPNLFTAGNLFFGFLAIIWCIRAKYVAENPDIIREFYTEAVLFILGALICDALDGRVARFGGRESLFGKEFDSIADTVSFGLAPCLMVFFLILQPTDNQPYFRQIGWAIGFIYLLCAGVRLARFNVITNPFIPGVDKTTAMQDFQGLPAPAAAGFIASLVLVLNTFDINRLAILLPPLMLLIAWLMVSNVSYPSFKHLDWHTHTNQSTFIIIIAVSAVATILLKVLVLPIIFLIYIFFGLIRHVRKSVHRHKKHAQ